MARPLRSRSRVGPSPSAVQENAEGHGYNRLEARLAQYHLDQGTTESLALQPGNFLAPAWSPQTETWLGVATDGDEAGRLQNFGAARPQIITTTGEGEVAFVWSPDGRQVLPDAEWMQWRVYDVATGEDRGFTTFQPTPQMRFIMASFNQYAQSHRFWSPDSRYLVYASQEGGGSPPNLAGRYLGRAGQRTAFRRRGQYGVLVVAVRLPGDLGITTRLSDVWNRPGDLSRSAGLTVPQRPSPILIPAAGKSILPVSQPR